MAYRIEYSPDSETHLQYLTARQQAIVLDAVEEQLTYQPTVATRNRNVEEEPETVVYINAVGVKEGNQLRIAGEIYEL